MKVERGPAAVPVARDPARSPLGKRRSLMQSLR